MARRRFSPFMLLFCLGLLLSSATANSRHLKGQAIERNKRTRTAPKAVTAPNNSNTTATDEVNPPNNYNASTATTDNSNTTSEGSPSSVVVTNTTLPQECMPISTECMDRLRPLAKAAHNHTAGSEEKNSELHDFCATDCGTNYTNHVTAILQGKCISGLPPRNSGSYSSNQYGGTGTGVTVVVNTPRSSGGGASVDVNTNTAVNRPGRQSDNSNHTIYQGDDDDDDDDDYDDDDNEDDSNLTEQEIMDRFEQDRPGTALGCVKAHDGQYCAEKSGCDFWNSCCYSSWARLGAVAGYPLTTRTVRAVDYFCPGATRYVDVDGCT